MRILCLTLLLFLVGLPSQARDLLVFAAASLRDGLDAALADWPRDVTVSYAGTSTLARQISGGAPADIFIAASPEWMDVLGDRGLLRARSRRDLLGNTLVLVAHDPAAPAIVLDAETDLVAALDGGVLAMALTDAVPAGIYGRQAFVALGLWDNLRPHVAQTDNVRAALRLVERGEASLGVVYGTDARAGSVRPVAEFPAGSHAPIRYPAAMMAASDHPDAEAFLDFLASDAGLAHFRAAGFTVLP